MRWLNAKSSAIPTQLQLLRLVYVGRMCLATAIYVTAALKIRLAAPLHILGTSPMPLSVTALLMPPANAGLVTLFAGLVYFADVFWGHSAGVTAGIWIQLGVFMLVAIVTAYVASRVNVMGAEREALAAEVRQVQLEADDVLRNLRTGVLTVDADGRLLYANPASEEILGFRAREWLGRSVMPEFARLAPEFW